MFREIIEIITKNKKANDLSVMAKLLDKLHEKNRQLRRLQAIWNNYAYNW